MEDVLAMLYHGKIRPEEDDYTLSPALEGKIREYGKLQKKAIDGMDAVQKEMVNRLLEARMEVFALEIEDAYVRGMRMGAKLTAALLEEKKTSCS